MSRQQIVKELHRSARKNFPRRHVILKGIDDLWQADLVEMGEYAKENKKYKYLLTVIDCFSKFAWVKPLLNKSKDVVAKAFFEILSESKRTPKNLQSDNGTEFYNRAFQNLMTKFNINHYSSYSMLKASIVERFNRTLKEKMWKHFSMQGSYKWVNILPKLITEYNNTYHRTIKMAPYKVNKKNEKALLDTVFNPDFKLVRNKFKIGDMVRISKYKKHFEKGYTPNWTTEIFKVVYMSNKFPVTYLLKDIHDQPIAGRFYEYELQKALHPDVYLVEKILKRKGNKMYVKWLGFDKTHNSWVNSQDII